jgi:predicted phosphodiesterase|tara:strand:+ start:377 stop:1147 length:771 start_codon:yes stop_codon:yes gene_type:complete
MSGLAKIAVISCTHCPFMPEETKDWILNTLSDIKGLTHFGHLGDLFEAGAGSIHANEYSHTLQDEYESGYKLLKALRGVLPASTKRWCNMGNHDDNLLTEDPRRVPREFRDLVDWRKHPEFGEEFRSWEWTPYEKSPAGCYKVGQCIFYHGFDAGQSSDELEGLQFMNFMGGYSNLLMVRGHTHRPVPPTQMRRTARIPLPWWYANVGTAGPLNPGWMKRKDTSQWGTAMLVVECKPGRLSRLNGVNWSAELLEMK